MIGAHCGTVKVQRPCDCLPPVLPDPPGPLAVCQIINDDGVTLVTVCDPDIIRGQATNYKLITPPDSTNPFDVSNVDGVNMEYNSYDFGATSPIDVAAVRMGRFRAVDLALVNLGSAAFGINTRAEAQATLASGWNSSAYLYSSRALSGTTNASPDGPGTLPVVPPIPGMHQSLDVVLVSRPFDDDIQELVLGNNSYPFLVSTFLGPPVRAIVSMDIIGRDNGAAKIVFVVRRDGAGHTLDGAIQVLFNQNIVDIQYANMITGFTIQLSNPGGQFTQTYVALAHITIIQALAPPV